MSDTTLSKLTDYRRSERPLAAANRLWPLYGAGWDNLGKEGGTLELPIPQPGPDELLVRHDAVGICFSDIKVIRAGEKRPSLTMLSSCIAWSWFPLVLGLDTST